MAKRASFNLDAQRTVLISTGNVAPVTLWVENAAPGSIRPQDTDPESGKLLWVIDCLDESDDEAQRASVVGVRVASNTEPHPVKYAPLAFESLSCSVYVQKSSGNLVSMFAGVLKPAQSAKAAA